MSKEFKQALFFVLLLIASYLGSLVSDPAKNFFIQISPISLFRLTSDHYIALFFTLSSAVVAWFFAIVIGYILGHLVGLASVHESSSKYLRWISVTVREIYNIIYIIPLVITLNLCYSLLMYHKVHHDLPGWVVVVGSIAVTGIALGGYQVFINTYKAVVRSGDERLYLTKSLFSRPDQVTGATGLKGQAIKFIKPYRQSSIIAKRLANFEIRSFVSALEIAFHLAVVGVVILESITPQFYEYLIPQTGVLLSWGGGVGRLVLVAQSNYQFQIIAGMLWAVVFFDGCIVFLINLFARNRWLKYYGSLP